MGQFAFNDSLHEVEYTTGVSFSAGRRSLLKAGLSLSVVALWQSEPVWSEANKMAESKKTGTLPAVLTYEDERAVSPALEFYTKGSLLDGVWKRPELSRRDRSVVTVAALIARIQAMEMPYHFALALDNGVEPAELSEIITHLTFYAGWANAMAAIAVAKTSFISAASNSISYRLRRTSSCFSMKKWKDREPRK